MRIVETKGRIAEDGSIILPCGVLEGMCMEAGDSVNWPVEGPRKASISLPCELLHQAGMPPDGELEVRTVPGGIIIGIADPVDTVPEPLMKLFTDLGIQPEAVRKVLEKGGFPDEQW